MPSQDRLGEILARYLSQPKNETLDMLGFRVSSTREPCRFISSPRHNPRTVPIRNPKLRPSMRVVRGGAVGLEEGSWTSSLGAGRGPW